MTRPASGSATGVAETGNNSSLENADSCRLALVQVPPAFGDREANLRTIEKVLRARRGRCDMAVFGELFLTGYMNRDRLLRLAEPLDGPSVKRLMRAAASTGIAIVCGLPERDSGVRGHIYNTALYIPPYGEVVAYRKWHLANFGPFEEKAFFTPGKDLPLVKAPFGKFGMQICYDIFFPELSKYYAMNGADILICISASPSTTRPFFEKVFPARAIENTAFLVFVNLTGVEEAFTFWGGAVAYGPRGDIKAGGAPFTEGVVDCVLDMHEVELARPHRPTLRDTRRELFREIAGGDR